MPLLSYNGVFPQVNDQLPEAFSLLGYAFYLQPLIMPIIREMPEGRSGRQALTAAVHSSLLGKSTNGTMWLQFLMAQSLGPVRHSGAYTQPKVLAAALLLPCSLAADVVLDLHGPHTTPLCCVACRQQSVVVRWSGFLWCCAVWPRH